MKNKCSQRVWGKTPEGSELKWGLLLHEREWNPPLYTVYDRNRHDSCRCLLVCVVVGHLFDRGLGAERALRTLWVSPSEADCSIPFSGFKVGLPPFLFIFIRLHTQKKEHLISSNAFMLSHFSQTWLDFMAPAVSHPSYLSTSLSEPFKFNSKYCKNL